MNRRSRHTNFNHTAPIAIESSGFDDEENVILTFIVAQCDQIIANTASTGKPMDEKNRVWDLIRERLSTRANGVVRTDEQVRNRWRSMRSSYAFKTDKARNLAEMYYRKIENTNHSVRMTDVQVPGITMPLWMTNMLKHDTQMKLRSTKRSHRTTATAAAAAASNLASESSTSKRARKSAPTHLGMALTSLNVPTSVFSYSVKQEHVDEADEVSPSSLSPPSVGMEEHHSVTESGVISRPASAIWIENDPSVRRRRDEEIHQAKLELLKAQTAAAAVKSRLMSFQLAAFMRDNKDLVERVDESTGKVTVVYVNAESSALGLSESKAAEKAEESLEPDATADAPATSTADTKAAPDTSPISKVPEPVKEPEVSVNITETGQV